MRNRKKIRPERIPVTKIGTMGFFRDKPRQLKINGVYYLGRTSFDGDTVSECERAWKLSSEQITF